MSLSRYWMRACFGLFAFSIASCSPGTVKISGKILKDGQPMVVSEDTYVTLSFAPELSDQGDDSKRSSYSAKFDQKSGTYTVELPAGKYRTTLIMAPPPKNKGEPSKPLPPIKSDKVYDLGKSQTLDIEVPK